MSARIALCIDEATYHNPETIGLDGESLAKQDWLVVYLTGDEARAGVGGNESCEEAWVVSSDDVEPINLAATLKADRPNLCVRLVEFEGCGSLFSRAHTALIDEVVDRVQFIRCYADAKRRYSSDIRNGGESHLAIDLAETAEASVKAEVETEVPPSKNKPDIRQPVAMANRVFLMPVVSGSGGAGKSAVSVMGALIASSLGYRTLLLDYDLQFGDAALLAGAENALAIDEAITHSDLLERELRRDQVLTILAAPSRLEASEGVVHAMPSFFDQVAGAFDVIIANTGAAWAEQHAVLLERCSVALFLIDQRASSVRACRHALELCARCGIASGPFQFAVNRCAKNAPLSSADVSCALQGAPVFELRDGGRDVEDYLGGGAAADLMDSRNEFCTSLQHVMESLLPGAPRRSGDRIEPFDGKRSVKLFGRHASRTRGRRTT